MPLAAVAERIFAAEDELLSVGCERTELPWASVLVDRAHPSIYDVNGVRNVRGVPDETTLWQALEAARAGGSRHHRASSRDPEAIHALDAWLLPRSFQRQVCVAMLLGAAPARTLPRGLRLTEVDGVAPGPLEAVERCQDEVRRDESWYTREVSRQMDNLAARQIRLGGARYLAAVTPDGIVAGALLVREAAGLAFIADVGTKPSHRGQGIASALICAAVARASRDGVTHVGLTARRDDPPRFLYERLGFAVVGEGVDLARPG